MFDALARKVEIDTAFAEGRVGRFAVQTSLLKRAPGLVQWFLRNKLVVHAHRQPCVNDPSDELMVYTAYSMDFEPSKAGVEPAWRKTLVIARDLPEGQMSETIYFAD